MKKFLKFLVVLLITYIAICQISKQVKAYTTEEWKEIIEYKEVAVDGEPPYSDVEININSLEPNAGFPIVRTTAELMIFGKEGFEFEDIEKFQDIMKGIDIFDIDFFNEEHRNINDTWWKIRNYVQLSLRVSFYITMAAMLTQLIYIAIIIVKSAIFSEDIQLPYEKQILAPYRKLLKHREGNVDKSLVHKKLIEQWVISIILIVVIVIGLSLIINFSKLISSYDDSEREMLNILVYVKDGTGATGSSNKGYYFKANAETLHIFQSQHLLARFAFQNMVFILIALVVIIFKFILLIFLYIRLIVVAVTISVAPILVFVNGLIKARGNKGFLRKWLIIYTVLVVLRPMMAVLYGIIS